MLAPPSILSPIEILVRIILNNYLNQSYCITAAFERPIDVKIPVTYTYLIPEDNLVDQLLTVSERGCSDYIIAMEEPNKFMEAFEKVNHLGNIRRSDRKLVFLPFSEDENGKRSLLNILARSESGFVMNMLLVVPFTGISGCTLYDLVTQKFVGPDGQKNKPEYMDQWNSCTEKFDNNVDLFPNKMFNLYGKTLKVASFTYKPYVILDVDTEAGRDGTEIRIVDEFCRWINCTIEIIRDDVNEWGEIYDNQTGVGVLGNVVEDRADIGITALYSWYDVFSYLDFSVSSIRSAITCIAPAPRVLASWEMPLLPFTWVMWLAMLITYILTSLALTIAQGCSSNNAFLATLGMIIGQSQKNATATWRTRCVSGWMLLAGVILGNAYGAGLASTFTVPKFEKSVDTIRDLVDKNLEWGATHDAWIFSIMSSEEPLVKKLVSQFRTYEAAELNHKSFTRSMAFSIEILPAGHYAIGEYITEEAVLDMMLMHEYFYYEQCVVMLRKSSAYTAKMSDLIGRLHETGLMLTWESQVALKYLNYKVQLEVKLSRAKRDVVIEPLKMRHVIGIFFVYFFGIIISTVLFILEILSLRKNVYGKNDIK